MIVVSSAYMSDAECSSIFGRSFINIRNKTGPGYSLEALQVLRIALIVALWHLLCMRIFAQEHEVFFFFCVLSVQHNFVDKRDEIKLLMFL